MNPLLTTTLSKDNSMRSNIVRNKYLSLGNMNMSVFGEYVAHYKGFM